MVEMGQRVQPALGEATKGMTAEEAITHYSQEIAADQADHRPVRHDEGLQVADDNAALAKSQDEIKAALDRWANVGWVKDLDRFGGLCSSPGEPRTASFRAGSNRSGTRSSGFRTRLASSMPRARSLHRGLGQTQGRLRQVPGSRQAQRGEQGGLGRVYDRRPVRGGRPGQEDRDDQQGPSTDGHPRRRRLRRDRAALEETP